MAAKKKISTVSKILRLQITVILVICLGFYLIEGHSKVLSPLLGGIVAFLPNLYLALRMARTTGQDAQKIVRSFYAGESGKLILTAMLFMIVFQLPDIELLPLLATYVAVLSVFWFALIIRD
ncbi:MAG: ATP synthase subunit I [Methylococcales bacterium]|nr:ATP synthase subunit I [Methylococcales bacterium]